MARLLISGSTGLIGSALATARRSAGDDVLPLVRGPAQAGAVSWDALTSDAVSGFDAVVHLAGEPLAGGRWTAAKKAAIRGSRVDGTTKLATALAAADRPPGVFVCASGINYYGERGDAVVDETTPAGDSFLAEVCVAWEAAAAPLVGRSRVVHLRMGAVLAPAGGMLAAVLPPFRLGLGGPVAGGAQYVSWVTLDDVVRAIGHVIASAAVAGPVNVVAPEPVTNRRFGEAVGAAVGRPAVVPTPGWAVRLLFGEFATETVLTSIRAVPRRLLDDGFTFGHATIGPALADVLGGGRR